MFLLGRGDNSESVIFSDKNAKKKKKERAFILAVSNNLLKNWIELPKCLHNLEANTPIFKTNLGIEFVTEYLYIGER